MGNRYQIAGSILSADPLAYGSEVADALEAGVDVIHFDVMDFNFVPNLTFGPSLLKALRKRFPKAVLDVHLMISPITEDKLAAFADAGADWISFHPEACVHLDRTLAFLADRKVKAGLALDPGTGPEVLDWVYDKLGFVLLMTVNPGFGGQRLIPVVLDKARRISAEIRRRGLPAFLEVDGGIDPNTITAAAKSGISVFVAGSAFFGKPDRAAALAALREPLERLGEQHA
ncbi:MAG: ribulose-phosphate 3-epimerase [Succinivibrionaceae bacterium]|nr:ribulose-phosphate 3-epimerase [Succinivibrionaceae bacterium]